VQGLPILPGTGKRGKNALPSRQVNAGQVFELADDDDDRRGAGKS
jgi:hypothetical protein